MIMMIDNLLQCVFLCSTSCHQLVDAEPEPKNLVSVDEEVAVGLASHRSLTA